MYPDFIAKMKIVEEEADEAAFWLELIDEKGIKTSQTLLKEAREILAINVSSINTVRKRLQNKLVETHPSTIYNHQSTIPRGVTQAAKGDRL